MDIAAVARRYGMTLVETGIFSDRTALEAFAADMEAFRDNPLLSPLLWKYGLGPAMTDESVRCAELSNWLATQMAAHAQNSHRFNGLGGQARRVTLRVPQAPRRRLDTR
ncbi:MAG: hypothetical protein ACRES6_04380 [Steroidobacteraceae bacterium]